MTEFLIALTHPNVHDVLNRLAFSSTSYLLVETMEHEQALSVLGNKTYVILDTCANLRDHVDAYSSGRVFDSIGELKWQKEGANVHFVYIGDEAQANALKTFKPEAADPVKLSSSREPLRFLWGRKVAKERVQTEMQFEATDHIFIELQIPQYLCYPVPAADNARLKMLTREYSDTDGNLQYYRLVTITE